MTIMKNKRINNRLVRAFYYSLVYFIAMHIFSLSNIIPKTNATLFYYVSFVLYLVFIITLPKLLFLNKHVQDESMEEMLDYKYNVLGIIFFFSFICIGYFLMWTFVPGTQIHEFVNIKNVAVQFIFINLFVISLSHFGKRMVTRFFT